MTKMYVSMAEDEFVELLRMANRECLHPREQVRHILRTVLFADSSNSSKTADSTCLVSQANQVRSGFAEAVNS